MNELKINSADGAQICLIGLGSNLGDCRAILQRAVQSLRQIGAVEVSLLYQSPPMGPQDQPDYLNAVVQLTTTFTPLALLDHLQHLEYEAGRVRKRHWGERTLDLDLLFYGDEQIDHPRLQVPHPGISSRDFVVLPILDLVPNQQVNGQPLYDAACLKDSTIRVIAEKDWAEVR